MTEEDLNKLDGKDMEVTEAYDLNNINNEINNGLLMGKAISQKVDGEQNNENNNGLSDTFKII